MPKIPVTAEPPDWKEYRLTMDVEDATTTLSDCAEYATGKNTTFTQTLK